MAPPPRSRAPPAAARSGSGSSAADAAVLGVLPGVVAVQLAGDRVVLDSGDPDATARALLRTDLDLHDLEIAGPGLEEAFLALTGGDPLTAASATSNGDIDR